MANRLRCRAPCVAAHLFACRCIKRESEPAASHFHSLVPSLSSSLSLSCSPKRNYSATIAAAPRSLPPPCHCLIAHAHHLAITSSTSPTTHCLNPRQGKGLWAIAVVAPWLRALPPCRLPWLCMPSSLPCVLLDVRVRLELGLARGKSLRPMPASSEQNTVVPPLHSRRHARGQASPPLHPDLIHVVELR